MIDCIQNTLFAELMTNRLCWQMENFRASKNAQGNMIKKLRRLSNRVIFELFVGLQQTKFLNIVLLFKLVLSTVNSYSSKSPNRKRKGQNKAGDLLFVIWLRCVEKKKLFSSRAVRKEEFKWNDFWVKLVYVPRMPQD